MRAGGDASGGAARGAGALRSGDCRGPSGRSYATNLSHFIGDPTHVFPLCEAYAPALDGVLGFAQTLVQTQLEDDEHVTSVIVIGNDGAERNLPSAAYRFDEATGTLEVDPMSIRGDDLNLRVEITSDCRPIVQ